MGVIGALILALRVQGSPAIAQQDLEGSAQDLIILTLKGAMAEQPAPLAPPPPFNPVQILTEPSGASLWVDGTKIEETSSATLKLDNNLIARVCGDYYCNRPPYAHLIVAEKDQLRGSAIVTVNAQFADPLVIRIKLEPIPSLWVVDFDQIGDIDLVSAGAIVSNWAAGAIHHLGRYRVVERSGLKNLLAEQELSVSGITDPATAIRIGKLTGAKFVVTGKVARLSRTIEVTMKRLDVETGAELSRKSIDLSPGLWEANRNAIEAAAQMLCFSDEELWQRSGVDISLWNMSDNEPMLLGVPSLLSHEFPWVKEARIEPRLTVRMASLQYNWHERQFQGVAYFVERVGRKRGRESLLFSSPSALEDVGFSMPRYALLPSEHKKYNLEVQQGPSVVVKMKPGYIIKLVLVIDNSGAWFVLNPSALSLRLPLDKIAEADWLYEPNLETRRFP